MDMIAFKISTKYLHSFEVFGIGAGWLGKAWWKSETKTMNESLHLCVLGRGVIGVSLGCVSVWGWVSVWGGLVV